MNLNVWNGHKRKLELSPNWENRIKRMKKEYIEQIEYMEMEDLIILDNFVFCIDCGKPIRVNGKKNNAVKSCPECQAKYRRKYKAEKEKERRKKKKNK